VSPFPFLVPYLCCEVNPMIRVENNNNILVPVDFSDISNNALNHAVNIARVYNNEITLLHIVDENFFQSIFSSSQSQLMEEAIHARLDKLIESIRSNNPGIVLHKRLERGKVYKTIAQVANDGKFDSIMMGSNGASGLEKIIGSNASRVIQLSKVPVIVIKSKPFGEGYRKIVLPIDLSLESKQKVGWAIHVAKKFNSIIHVISESSSDEFLLNRIHANIRQVEAMIEKEGVQYVSKALEDKVFENFATETLTYSNAIEADLIVIMTQPETSIVSMAIGTLAQQMVNDSDKIPVMCINPVETGYTFDY
jgi:nucleotide-binding universal stress UspA family protein